MGKKVCIYHFTDATKRPIVNQKQIDILQELASSIGEIEKIYLDYSLKLSEQVQRQQLIQDIKNYDVLVMKDFYHLARNTGACIGLHECSPLQT